jgi:hypothetical protein
MKSSGSKVVIETSRGLGQRKAHDMTGCAAVLRGASGLSTRLLAGIGMPAVSPAERSRRAARSSPDRNARGEFGGLVGRKSLPRC